MPLDRRTFVRASGTAVAGSTFLAGRAAAREGECGGYGYGFVGTGPAPYPTEIKVDGNYAFLSTGDSVTVVDAADPRLPVLIERARAPGKDHRDVKLGRLDDGTPVATLAQDDSNPGGVVVYERQGDGTLVRGNNYETGAGIHNHDVDDRGYAYLCVNDPFTNPRIVVVDANDAVAGEPEGVPVTTSADEVGGDEDVRAIFRLRDVNEPMAEAGLNVAHDVFVERRGGREERYVAHVCFWDAGIVSVDVTDPSDPVAVAHFNAVEDAHVEPRSTTEFYSRYVGMPGNSHYSRPTPDGDYLFVGAEAYPDPTGTAIPDEHGGIKVFDLAGMNLRSPLTHDPQNPDADPTYDPTQPAAVERIAPPKDPEYGALRTSHNFDFTGDGTRFYSAWYQGGIRAYDTADPTDICELAAFVSPDGNAFWGAQALAGEDTTLDDPGRRFTLGSKRESEGVVALELVRAEGGTDSVLDAADVGDLDETDVFTGTMAEPLD